MDDPKVMNKLVFDYLEEHTSKKMANDFAKSVGKKNIEQKLNGIPSITHMVSELIKNKSFPSNGIVNGKRKVEETNGHGPKSKKSKPNSESDGSEDSSSEEDSSDDEKEKKPATPAVMNGKKKEDSSSDEDSSDDEEENSPKTPQKAVAKKEDSSSEDDSSDDEETETDKAKPVTKTEAKKEESSSSEESDSDEDEEEKKPEKAKPKDTKEESSSDEDSDSDEEETPAKKVESKPKKDESSDSDDSDDDDEDDKPSEKDKKKEESSSESEESSDEEEEKKEDNKKEDKKEEPMEVDDDFKVTNNKTPNKSFNGSNASKGPNDGGEYYVKMSGVPFRASVQELKDFFKGGPLPTRVEHSLNEDGRNSGHAYAAFDSEEAAEKAMLKDREYMGQRYVSLSRSDNFGTSQVKKYDGNSSVGEYSVKMSGVPFRAAEKEIKDFFIGGDLPTKVQVIMNDEGRASGEVLAEFESEEAVQKALLKDHEYMGQRYVIVRRYNGK